MNIKRDAFRELDKLHELVRNHSVYHDLRLEDVNRIDADIADLRFTARLNMYRVGVDIAELKRRVARLEDSTTALGGADSAQASNGVSRSGGLGEAAPSPAFMNDVNILLAHLSEHPSEWPYGAYQQVLERIDETVAEYYENRELSTSRDKCLPDCAGDCPACTTQQECDHIRINTKNKRRIIII